MRASFILFNLFVLRITWTFLLIALQDAISAILDSVSQDDDDIAN